MHWYILVYIGTGKMPCSPYVMFHTFVANLRAHKELFPKNYSHGSRVDTRLFMKNASGKTPEYLIPIYGQTKDIGDLEFSISDNLVSRKLSAAGELYGPKWIGKIVIPYDAKVVFVSDCEEGTRTLHKMVETSDLVLAILNPFSFGSGRRVSAENDNEFRTDKFELVSQMPAFLIKEHTNNISKVKQIYKNYENMNPSKEMVDKLTSLINNDNVTNNKDNKMLYNYLSNKKEMDVLDFIKKVRDEN